MPNDPSLGVWNVGQPILGFEPSKLELFRKLAQMLRDVGSGGASFQRVFSALQSQMPPGAGDFFSRNRGGGSGGGGGNNQNEPPV